MEGCTLMTFIFSAFIFSPTTLAILLSSRVASLIPSCVIDEADVISIHQVGESSVMHSFGLRQASS